MKKVSKKINIFTFIVRAMFGIPMMLIPLLFGFNVFEFSNEWKITGLVISIIVAILALTSLVVSFYLYRYNWYQVESEEIRYQAGVLFKSKVTIPIRRIQLIEKEIGPLSAIFKMANIKIYTAGATTTIACLDNETANNLIAEINDKLQTYLETVDYNND